MEDRDAAEGRARPLPEAQVRRQCRRRTAATWRWRSISTPASSAISASAPAAKCRSMTSSAWPAAAICEKIVFDFDDPMGASTCVACGECVQACPTGALMPATMVDENNVYKGKPDRTVDSVCPYCGVGCQLTYQIKDDKIVAVDRQERPGQPEPALRQRPLRLRLRAQSAAAAQADDPQGRRAESAARIYRPVQSLDAFPRGDLGRGARPRRRGLEENPRPRRAAGAGRLRLGQGLERGGLSVPETGAHRLRHQQCRSLHAAVPRLLGGGAARRRRLGGGDRDLQRVQEFRRHHRHRRQSDREPSGRRDLLQAGGQARRQAHRDGSARPGAQAPCLAHDAVQERHRRGDAQRHAQRHRRREALRPAIYPDLCRGLRRLEGKRQGFHAGGNGADLRHSRPTRCARSRAPMRAPKAPSSSGAWACRSTPTAPTMRAA